MPFLFFIARVSFLLYFFDRYNIYTGAMANGYTVIFLSCVFLFFIQATAAVATVAAGYSLLIKQLDYVRTLRTMPFCFFLFSFLIHSPDRGLRPRIKWIAISSWFDVWPQIYTIVAHTYTCLLPYVDRARDANVKRYPLPPTPHPFLFSGLCYETELAFEWRRKKKLRDKNANRIYIFNTCTLVSSVLDALPPPPPSPFFPVHEFKLLDTFYPICEVEEDRAGAMRNNSSCCTCL